MAHATTVLALDPGETTGYAFLQGVDLVAAGEMRLNVSELWQFLHSTEPDEIVCENFVLYANKAQSLSWSTFYTVRLIGVVELYAELNKLPWRLQLAAEAKGFIKNVAGNGIKGKHAPDAVRHAYYYCYKTGRLGARQCLAKAVGGIRTET